MRIIVNHVTRMQPGYICIAGVDVATGKHVRPVLRGRLTTALLARNGGPFAIASLVDLGPVDYDGRAPELEDYRFESHRAWLVASVSPANFWTLLRQVARPRLSEIFGPVLRPNGHGCAVDCGAGEASLGCLTPATAPVPHIDTFGKIRIGISDGMLAISPSVTDLRLYESDQITPRRGAIEDIARRIKSGVPVILSVGLTRAWKKPNDTVERHWLQVNNIHLSDNPVWHPE